MKKQQKIVLLAYANGTDIMSVVARDALANKGYEIGYLNDVVNHGCVSGTCNNLIYYKDTHAFYLEHQDECNDILNEYEDNTGEGFKFEGRDILNTLAWIGYEDRAHTLFDELEDEE